MLNFANKEYQYQSDAGLSVTSIYLQHVTILRVSESSVPRVLRGSVREISSVDRVPEPG